MGRGASVRSGASALGWVRGGANPFLLGFGLTVGVPGSLSLLVSSSQGASPDVGWLVSLVRIVAFAALALWAGTGHRLSDRPAGMFAATAACTAGIIAMGVATLAGATSPALLVAGYLCASAGYAALYLYWVELYARMDLFHVVVYFCATHLVSSLVSYGFSWVGEAPVRAVLLALFPVLSAALYRLSLRSGSDAPCMRGENIEEGWSFPLLPVILLATFSLASGLSRRFLPDDVKGTILLGVAAAALLALTMVKVRAERFELGDLYAVCLPLAVAATLCALVPAAGFDAAGGALSNAAYTLFSVYCTALLCSISYRYGAGAAWLFGFACAASTAGNLVAGLLYTQLERLGHDPVVVAVSVSAIVVAFVVLGVSFSGRGSLTESWGIERLGGEVGSREATARKNAEKDARCARVRGLTRREEEVLGLLVEGKPFAEIEDELSISNATLKTHAHHIYEKLAVSGRHELAVACGIDNATWTGRERS